MTTLVLLLEEPSAKALLESVVPRLVPSDVHVQYLSFQGKSDLENSLARKLMGWRTPETRFVVLRDQDAANCKVVKARLIAEVAKTRRTALIRLACRTLEAWIAGDLDALATAYERPDVARQAVKEKFRDPDALGNPVDDIRLLIPEYQKIDGARRVGPLLDPSRNRSRSFRVFCAGVRELFESSSGSGPPAI